MRAKKFPHLVSVMLILFVLAVGLGWAATAQAVWVKETVATTGDQGQYASIALDSENTPHIAWYDASNARLYYGVRDWDGWDITLVDSGQVGQWASIAVSPVTDLPAIAYYDASNQAAKFAWFDGSDWNVEFISDGSTLRGNYIRLAYRSDGVPFVSYHYDDGAFAYMGVRVAWRNGPSAWGGHNVDEALWPFDMGAHTALGFDSANYPQVAYRDQTLGYQKFGWQNASGWFFEFAIDLDQAGEWADMAVDSGDNVYISSYNTETLGDECACVIAKVAGNWSQNNVDCGSGEYGSYTGLAVDSNDLLHLTYYAAGKLNYAYEDGARGWVIETLDDSSDTGKFTDVALDTFDSPYIVYYNATGHDLEYIYDQPLPAVTSITPNSALNTDVLIGAIIGGNFFLPGSTVKLVTSAGDLEINGANVSVDTQQQITCDFDLTGVPIGTYDVVVTTSAGSGSLDDGFTVTTNPPVLSSIDPVTGTNDSTAFPISLDGQFFTPALTATLLRDGSPDHDADSVTVSSTTEAEAVFNIKNMAPGLWSVKITTEFGESTLVDAFEITCGAPIAAFGALPRSGPAPLEVKFTNTSVDYQSCDITSTEWDFGDGETSTENAPTHTYAAPGLYAVSLTVTSDGGADTETKQNYIEVTEAPDDDTAVDDDTTTDDDVEDDDAVDDDDEADDDLLPPGDDDTVPSGDDDDDTGGCGC